MKDSNRLLVIFLFLLQSCSFNLYEHNHFGGTFINKTKFSVHKIELNKNREATIYRNIPNRNDIWKGNWKIISNDKIVLFNCDTLEDDMKLEDALAPPFDLNNDTIIVENRNLIRFDQFPLKRKIVLIK